MRFKTFNEKEIAQIVKNKNVSKFCGTYIAYTKEFKIKAVRQYLNEDMSIKQIFEQAGFDLNIIGRNKPRNLMHDWLTIFKAKGVKGFSIETRGRGKGGGRPKKLKLENLTDSEKIKRLELQILYLQKENLFLKNLRAMRAE